MNTLFLFGQVADLEIAGHIAMTQLLATIASANISDSMFTVLFITRMCSIYRSATILGRGKLHYGKRD